MNSGTSVGRMVTAGAKRTDKGSQVQNFVKVHTGSMQGCFCGLSHSFVALTYTPDEYRKLVCRTEAGRKTKDGTDGCAASLAETLPGLCLF